jgi:hypothetical protein
MRSVLAQTCPTKGKNMPKTISVKISNGNLKKLETVATDKGRTVSDEAAYILETWFKENLEEELRQGKEFEKSLGPKMAKAMEAAVKEWIASPDDVEIKAKMTVAKPKDVGHKGRRNTKRQSGSR